MSFITDPKPQKRVNSKSGEKLKSYSCKYCGEKYEMTAKEYGSRSMGAAKRSCKSTECMKDAAMAFLDKKKAVEKKEWNKRKEVLKQDVGKKVKQSQEPLQKSINKIVRLLDKGLPCLARPTEVSQHMDAGHIFSVGAHPSLRYNVWNIHAQSVKSNRDMKGEQGLMMDGLEIRYGKGKRLEVESFPGKYKTIKLSAWEKRDALKIANQIIRDLEVGKTYTRDEVNVKIGIYL